MLKEFWCKTLFTLSGIILGAQVSLAFSLTGTADSGQPMPIEIDAKSGITCEQKGRVCTARGDVIVTQGDTTMTCDVLSAFFHMDAQGRPQDLIRLEAQGRVRLKAKEGTQRGSADRAVFFVPTSHVVLTGDALFLSMNDTTVRARDTLEYFDQEKKALARGEAQVQKEDRILRAHHMDAYFKDGPSQQLTLERIEGRGEVFVSTPTDIAQGDEGVYTDADQVVVLTHNVRITRRGQGHMTGQRGRFDMKNGVAHLLPPLDSGENSSTMASASRPSAPERVKVLLLPRQPKRTERA